MWRMERLGWAAMALIVLAAVAGLFGHGPVSRTTAGNPSSIRVEYERFARHGGRVELTAHLPPNLVGEAASVTLDRAFLERVRISGIAPRPEAETMLPDGVRYRFAVSGQPAAPITFHLEPQEAGLVSGSIRGDGGPPVPVRLFIYP